MGGGHEKPHLHHDYYDDHRPRYHVQPPAGWLNDPNGPVYYNGRYHMFYQHLPEACEWDFGIIWGHAVSSNLVHWEHLPPALVPTPGWVDADGCFSGCCVISPTTGKPIILYTGVRLRSNQTAAPLPPPEHDLGMVWIESQCAAVPCDDNDDLLINWRKLEVPFLALPPSELQLTGWRDPFIFKVNTRGDATLSQEEDFSDANGRGSGPFGAKQDRGESVGELEYEYRMLMGSGIKGQGGTVLVYRSTSLTQGWELEGQLCEGSSDDTGVVWECPLLIPLHPVPDMLRAPAPHAPPIWLMNPQKPSSATMMLPSSSSALFNDAQRRLSSDGDRTGARSFRRHMSSTISTQGQQQQPYLRGELPATFPVSTSHQSSTLESALLSPNNGQLSAAGALMTAGQLPVPPHANAQAELDDNNALEFAFSSSSMDVDASRLKQDEGLFGGQARTALRLWPGAHPPTDAGGDGLGMNRKISGVDPPVMATEDLPKELPGSVIDDLASNLERAATLESWGTYPNAPGGGSSLNAFGSVVTENGSSQAGTAVAAEEKMVQDREECDDAEEDKFALAHSRVPKVSLSMSSKRTHENRTSSSRAIPHASAAAQLSAISSLEYSKDNGLTSSYSHLGVADKKQQWHLFTVSPDAPTNPVLYWTGHVATPSGVGGDPEWFTNNKGQKNNNCARFLMETAKGPFRLDLGDILYAPNVCQDDRGRWLLWGWLQERRKVGSYLYAGCLSLPRVLHVTDEGRLIQAPAPELVALREGRAFHAQHITLYPEAVVPIGDVSGDRLDIECTIERGSAFAAGLLFRSHEAEAEGSTAVVYDWDRNQLEAIFNVPANWQPHGPPPTMRHTAAGGGGGGGGGLASPSDIFDDEGIFDPASYLCTPRFSSDYISRTPSLAALSPHAEALLDQSPSLSVDHDDDISLDSETLSGGYLGEGVAAPIPVAGGSASMIRRTGSSLSLCLQRTNSLSQVAGSFPAAGTSYPRIGSFIRTSSFLTGSPRSQATGGGAPDIGGVGDHEDEDLGNLLEDLAAPMRAAEEAAAPAQEPRRVGGPLLMHPCDRLHLRIVIDHSCVEVYAGTGEVLSTRIYRGKGPDDLDPGLDFVAFGGAAILESVSAYEVGCAWPSQTKGSGVSTPIVQAASVHDGPAGASGANQRPASPILEMGRTASERANDLFDDIMMDIGAQMTTAN